MFGDFDGVIEKKVRIAQGGLSSHKIMPLSEAVRKFVTPGMHLHIGHSYARPCAAVRELARQFWGKDPEFTLSTLGFTGDMVVLFAGGLLKKSIATFYGDSYPMPGPNPVYQKAFRDGSVEMEHWTILSFSLRLLAGALGMDFIPCRSLVGTSMEKDNSADYFVSETVDGGKMGLARALRPDITFLHAWAADAAGNVVCSPPYAEGPTSARGARLGAIVTVEKVVSHNFIRKYSHFVKIPSYLVLAVCPAEMGTHPGGMANYGLESEFMGYEVDKEFLIDLREKCRDEDELNRWIERWVLDCRSHDDYLERLGHERVWYLKGKSAPDSWKSELVDALPEMDAGGTCNPVEMMIAVGARVIANKAKERGYRTILAGVGASNLAAWAAYYSLMEEGYDIDLMAEVGFYGYSPQPADPYIFNLRNVPNCRMLTDVNDVLGSLVGAESNRCIGSLGAGQVDKLGNINSTAVPEMKLLLVGSGGAADVAAGAREVVILIDHSRFRLVDRVPYVTCPGERVTACVTTRGILEKRGGKLTLTGYFQYPGESEGDAVDAARAECGWNLEIAPDVRKVDAPTVEELRSIRIFDPHRYFIGKRD